MKIQQAETAIACWHGMKDYADSQSETVLAYIKMHGGDWTIAEIAQALGWEKSTASRAINTLINAKELVAKPERKGKTYPFIRSRPVGLPWRQMDIFQ